VGDENKKMQNKGSTYAHFVVIIVVGKQGKFIFCDTHSDSPYKYHETDIKGMLGFLVDNIIVVFGDQVFQQTVGIPMGTNCAPLLADLFLYSYTAEFVQKLLRDNNKKLAVSFNHTFKYIDDVLSIIMFTIMFT
jgi:hypothetical protein